MLIYLVFSAKKSIKIHAVYNYFICTLLFIFFVVYFLNFHVFDIKEPFYHLYFIFMIFLCSIYFNNSLALRHQQSVIKKNDYLFFVVIFYFSGSLLLYFLYWDEVATIISKHDAFNDIKMDGYLKRCFGLLFNPLSSAFSMLLIFIFLYLSGYKYKLVYWLLATLIILSAVRTAILILLVFILGVVINRGLRFIVSLFLMLQLH